MVILLTYYVENMQLFIIYVYVLHAIFVGRPKTELSTG